MSYFIQGKMTLVLDFTNLDEMNELVLKSTKGKKEFLEIVITKIQVEVLKCPFSK